MAFCFIICRLCHSVAACGVLFHYKPFMSFCCSLWRSVSLYVIHVLLLQSVTFCFIIYHLGSSVAICGVLFHYCHFLHSVAACGVLFHYMSFVFSCGRLWRSV